MSLQLCAGDSGHQLHVVQDSLPQQGVLFQYAKDWGAVQPGCTHGHHRTALVDRQAAPEGFLQVVHQEVTKEAGFYEKEVP